MSEPVTIDDAAAYEAPGTIFKMLFTAQTLLASMNYSQRQMCERSMDDPSRFDWDFIPKPDRSGIPLAQLNSHQRTMVHSMLATGLSRRGYSQALSIMAMENILRERDVDRIGVIAGDIRNDELYYITIFGRPGFDDTWSWRFLGHHLSLTYTIIGQRWITVTPCNMGAEPARAGVITPLAFDDDVGLEILHGVSDAQRKDLVIHDVAPADYTTRQVPRVGKVEYPDHVDLGIPFYRITDEDREALKFEKDRPRGVAAADMAAPVRSRVMDLVESYVGRMPEEIARPQMERIKAEGLENVHFCWAGGLDHGTPHYYRIQTGQILIEFDNAIDDGDHIHSIWRDYRNDLGHQLLLDHYEHQKHHGHHLAMRLESSVPDDDDGHTHEHGHTHE